MLSFGKIADDSVGPLDGSQSFMVGACPHWTLAHGKSFWRKLYALNSRFARTIVTSRAMLPYVAPLAKTHVEAIPLRFDVENHRASAY